MVTYTQSNKSKVRDLVAFLIVYETFGNAMSEACERFPISDKEKSELRAEFYNR